MDLRRGDQIGRVFDQQPPLDRLVQGPAEDAMDVFN